MSQIPIQPQLGQPQPQSQPGVPLSPGLGAADPTGLGGPQLGLAGGPALGGPPGLGSPLQQQPLEGIAGASPSGPPIGPRVLSDARDMGNKRMKPFRDGRRDAIQEYVGRWYGQSDEKHRPLNLVNQAVSVLIPHLVAPKPEYTHIPNFAGIAPQSLVLSVLLNRLTAEIDLAMTFRRCVINAILGPRAIMKIGQRAGSDMVKIQGRLYNKGQPYATDIDLDDYTPDPTARNDNELYWEGHHYRLPRQVALASGIFNNADIERLPRVSERAPGFDLGVESLSTRALAIGSRFEAIDIIELWDGVIYDEDKSWSVTLPGHPGYVSNRYLLEEEHQGPERGPYRHLWFHDVPNNLMGLPPVAIWRDLAEALNLVAAKIMDQAANAKNVFAYSRDSADDAMSVRDAADMEAIAVDNVKEMQQFQVGGVVADLHTFLGTGMGWWNMQSGQVGTLGGEIDQKLATGIQAEQANAGVRLRDLQSTNNIFMENVGNDLTWILATDPLMQASVPYRIPGGEYIEVQYDAAAREGDALDFGVKLEVHNAIASDPMVRARRVVELMTNAVPALLTAHMTTGGLLDFPSALRLIGRELDIRELDQIVKDPQLAQMNQALFGQVPPGQGQPVGQSAAQPTGRFGVGTQGGPGNQQTSAHGVSQAAGVGQPQAA